jgi:hypothetical protein
MRRIVDAPPKSHRRHITANNTITFERDNALALAA